MKRGRAKIINLHGIFTKSNQWSLVSCLRQDINQKKLYKTSSTASAGMMKLNALSKDTINCTAELRRLRLTSVVECCGRHTQQFSSDLFTFKLLS